MRIARLLVIVALALSVGCTETQTPNAPNTPSDQGGAPSMAPAPRPDIKDPGGSSIGGLATTATKFPELELNTKAPRLHDSLLVPKQSPDIFPNEVGNWWKYERIDTVRVIHDTLVVEIVDTLTLDNGHFTRVWVYTNSEGADTEYVEVTNHGGIDSVRFYHGPAAEFTSNVFLLPLGTPEFWTGNPGLFWTDRSWYQTVEDVEISGRMFYGTHRAFRTSTGPFWINDWRTWTWITPRVGMVWRFHFQTVANNGPPRLVRQEWQALLEFNVKPI